MQQGNAREAELAARAAWLHYVGGLTQSEVARRLQVPTTRAHRYIARAQSQGLVRIFVDVSSAECVVLETELIERFGLSYCQVAMDSQESTDVPLKSLGAKGADYLMQLVTSGAHKIIGIGNGRTLAAAVGAMAPVDGSEACFVSMLGGLTRSYAANPYDVIHRLAGKTGSEAYLLPAPLFANSAEDKRVMLAQTGIAATMGLIAQATLAFVGIGNLDATGGVSASSLEGPDAIAGLVNAGARAEILGQFLDPEGGVMQSGYDHLVMAPALETLRGREVVAIAGGSGKVEAIGAALGSGLLTGLITDEATARRLVDLPGAGNAVAAAS